MSSHLKMVHPDKKDMWYEPDPIDLPAQAEDTTEEDLALAIDSSVKKEPESA